MSIVRVGLSDKGFADGYDAIFKGKKAARKAPAKKKPAAKAKSSKPKKKSKKK